MRDDPISLLERELVEAAKRRVQPAGSAIAGRRRTSLGAFAAVVLSGVAVAVALGALVSLRGHPTSSSPKTTPAATIPGRQELIDVLGVLRRPQTYADLHSPWIQRFLQGPFPILAGQGTPDLPLIRRVGVTPWGSGVVLIPEEPLTSSSRVALQRRFPNLLAGRFVRPRRTGEGVMLDVDSGGGCCATAADIESRGMVDTDGAGISFAGGSTQTRLTALVPDGVATVEFALPRQPNPGDPGAPIYPSALTVRAPVHDNVAAVQVDRECCGANVPMIWLAADGHVIKTIGDPAAASQVVAPPQPAPETALSRAAERDPSTPNRVWVTPSVGGPHADFSVHFWLLLNDADYRYAVSGTSCPQHAFPGGGGGGTGDLRGRLWSDSLTAVQGQPLCPGTYHVSVTVFDLGRFGYLKHPARPFGTATFTVTG
jgi:hypothetical protein